MRRNPFRHCTPPGWQASATAPRDGTVVELQNNFGVAPWFMLCRWVEGRDWVSASDPDTGMDDGAHVSWRPYRGNTSTYVDPTGGRQNDREYWLEAAGLAAR